MKNNERGITQCLQKEQWQENGNVKRISKN